MSKIRSFSYWVIRIIGILISLVLFISAFLFTQYILPGHEEITINKNDNIIFNVFGIALLLLILYGIYSYSSNLNEKAKNKLDIILVFLSTLWLGILSLFWNLTLIRIPEGDQAIICSAASFFTEGNYVFLQGNGYCQIYPQQLGLIWIVELIFRLSGTYNYLAIQIINSILVASVPGIINLILRELNVKEEIRIITSITLFSYFPLVFYSSWVYGDIPSIVFTLLAYLFLIKMINNFKVYYVALFLINTVLSVLVRRNSVIVIVALVLLSIISVGMKKTYKPTIVVLLTIVAVFVSIQLINSHYEKMGGEKLKGGLPAISWIAMGMQETRGACGWYNNMPKEVGNSLDWDLNEANEVFKQVISERIHYFANNPKEAIRFYTKKVFSQWDDPSYQSIYFSEKNTNEQGKDSWFYNKLYYSESVYLKSLSFLGIIQLIIYLGMFLYFLLAINKDEHPLTYLLAVTIIGGFLFSILWEAKARYSFPYFMMMVPCAFLGYGRLVEIMKKKEKGASNAV